MVSTDEQIKQAARDFREEFGKFPPWRALKEKLGGGSPDRLLRILREVRAEEEASTLPAVREQVELPQAVVDSLRGALSEMKAEAEAVALREKELRLKAEREAAEEIAELNDAIAELASERDGLQAELDVAREQAEKAKHAATRSNRAAANAKVELFATREALALVRADTRREEATSKGTAES